MGDGKPKLAGYDDDDAANLGRAVNGRVDMIFAGGWLPAALSTYVNDVATSRCRDGRARLGFMRHVKMERCRASWSWRIQGLDAAALGRMCSKV